MRILNVLCSAVYAGRGNTTLGLAVRAIVIKADGSVALHNDVSNKPLNYMGSGSVFTETVNDDGSLEWAFDARKESLQIHIEEVLSDVEVQLDPNTVALERDGTENHLQEWLSNHMEVFGESYKFVSREFPTGAGPVDLLLYDENNNPVAVEVKRVATPNAVYQVLRYMDALKESYDNVQGLIVALNLRPAMLVLAEKKGIKVVQVPADWNDNVPVEPEG